MLPTFRRYTLLAILLLMLIPTAASAAHHPKVVTFEHAEYLISDARKPPPDDANWQPITLPDNWALTRPGFKGQVWYRIHFFIDGHKPRSRSVYIPRNNANFYFIFIDRIPRGGNHAYTNPNLTDLHRPLIHGTAGLPPGDNYVYIRVQGDARYRHGLSRVTIGPPPLVRPRYYKPRYDLQVTSIAAFGTTLLIAGLLALIVWRSECHNTVLLWFGIVALSWSLCTFLMVWPPHVTTEPARQLLLYVARHLYSVPLLVLCLRVGNVRQPWLESALWLLFIAGGAAATMLDVEHFNVLATVNWLLFLALSLGFFAWLMRQQLRNKQAPAQLRNSSPGEQLRFRIRDRSSYFLPVTLMVVIGFTAHDWARWIGYVDYDDLLLTPFAMPFLILALGTTIITRYQQSARALARSNVELEQRVTDKANELELAYKEMQATQREQAVLRERQRLMNDMHDGLSANLVSLHNMVQSQDVDATEIAHRLDDTLLELRAIVDSLEPVEGDLGVVLGNIRYRMRTALEESGTTLRWQVEALPTLANLNPEKILNIQRIVLEALTNALRHAAAHTVTVSAHAVAERNIIVITISDDGVGFDPATLRGGRGLRNMRERAARIGITLDIQSRPGQGTSVTLTFPINLKQSTSNE